MAKFTIYQTTNPTAPPENYTSLFVDSTDGHLKSIDSNGTIVDLQNTVGDISTPLWTYVTKFDGGVSYDLVVDEFGLRNKILKFIYTFEIPDSAIGDDRKLLFTNAECTQTFKLSSGQNESGPVSLIDDSNSGLYPTIKTFKGEMIVNMVAATAGIPQNRYTTNTVICTDIINEPKHAVRAKIITSATPKDDGFEIIVPTGCTFETSVFEMYEPD
jgi:hypothetical protein